MTYSPAELADRLITDLFNEQDPIRRRAVIDELCAPDLSFVDPEGATAGLDEFDAKVTALLAAGPPTFRFTSAAPSQEAGEVGLHRWHLGNPGEAPVLSGTDVVIARDGKIAQLYTVTE